MSYDNPNFTIITPGGCNSFCNFCTDPFKKKPDPAYMANLVKALHHQLPAHFSQVSISGGEPTLSPDLEAILDVVKMSGRFKKVVLTTNGARLTHFVPVLKETINHLNVSRHAIGYEDNAKVFGTRQIVTDEALKAAAFELNKAGIDVNLNHVYGKDSALTVDYVLRYIEYARSVGATSVSFRYDQNENSLEPTYLEKLFSEWSVVRQGGCPVCRNHTVLVGGFPVVFKASFAEPSKAIADVYELVYHITGKLTTDWEGKTEFTPALAAKYEKDFAVNPGKQHDVVAHSVAAPNNPPSGQKRVPLPPVLVMAPTVKVTPSAVTNTTQASTSGLQPVRRIVPVSYDASYGGGCGGGGCGS
jgi:organic radical activating enzyme